LARQEGWYFPAVGQFLERADKTSKILDVKYQYPLAFREGGGYTPLDSCTGCFAPSQYAFNTYRRNLWKYKPPQVWWSLVLNKYFPGRFIIASRRLKNALHHISGNSQGGS